MSFSEGILDSGQYSGQLSHNNNAGRERGKYLSFILTDSYFNINSQYPAILITELTDIMFNISVKSVLPRA